MAVGLDIAFVAGKSSMITREREMAIISNNMARSTDVGYHRQTAVISSNVIVEGYAGYFGTGSHLESIVRQYDNALEANLRSGISQNGYEQAFSRKLHQVEDMMGAQGENYLNNSIIDFSSSLQALATSPESIVDRQTVLGTANMVANQFNNQYENLEKLRDNLADDVTGLGSIQNAVDKLNFLTGQIPQINDRIKELEEHVYHDQDANDLRDDRDKLVAEIAKMVQITVEEGSDHRYTIKMGDHILVDGVAGPPTETNDVGMTMDAITGDPVFTIDGITAVPELGELKGLVDARTYVVGVLDDLNTYATEFALILNTQHNAGFDLNGGAGGPLFDASIPGAMTVLISDPRGLAASDSTVESGNGDNVSAMWTAMTTDVGVLNNNTLMNNATRIHGKVAEDVYISDFASESSKNIEMMFRDAVFERSGVNMDEEMADMLSVQRAFQAAAKLINVIDEMLGTIISIA